MLQTSARLLRLLTLLQTRRFWSGRELGERMEVTERTVRRDVEKLRTLGYPIEATSGVAGGYQLGAGTSLPPLLLEDDEWSCPASVLTPGCREGLYRRTAFSPQPAGQSYPEARRAPPGDVERGRRPLFAARFGVGASARGRRFSPPHAITASMKARSCGGMNSRST